MLSYCLETQEYINFKGYCVKRMHRSNSTIQAYRQVFVSCTVNLDPTIPSFPWLMYSLTLSSTTGWLYQMQTLIKECYLTAQKPKRVLYIYFKGYCVKWMHRSNNTSLPLKNSTFVRKPLPQSSRRLSQKRNSSFFSSDGFFPLKRNREYRFPKGLQT